MTDPFEELGLPGDASLDDVRSARRRLALRAHPDQGGSQQQMVELNQAFDAAVKAVRARSNITPNFRADPPPAPTVTTTRMRWQQRRPQRIEHDAPSFTMNVLPAEAFEALLVVTTWLGETLVDDPPYQLEVHLDDPGPCWCRLELLPEAGSTSVSITVITDRSNDPISAEEVRDAYVKVLNQLG
jgi:hypothetical protein